MSDGDAYADDSYSVDVGPKVRPPPRDYAPWFTEHQLTLLLWALAVLTTLAKILLGTQANVLWEEAHFAVSGNHLDLAYPDIPVGAPVLAKLLTSLFGWNIEALRVPSALLSGLMPFACVMFARPLVGERRALWTGILACIFAPIAANGMLFYPEGFLQILLVAMLGLMVRAMAEDRMLHWVLAGLCAAAGVLIHYRFGLVGVGVLLFLCATSAGRKLWTHRGLYVFWLLGFAGLLPGLIYNVREHFSTLKFHAVERQVYGWNPSGLFGFLGEQIAISSLPFFAAFVAAMLLAYRTGFAAPRTGDPPPADAPPEIVRQGAALSFSVALVVFGVFLVLSPLYHTRYAHWPFLAYPAVLPFLAAALIALADGARQALARWTRIIWIGTGAVWCVAVALIVGLGHYFWAHPDLVPPSFRRYFAFQMEDWTAIGDTLRTQDQNLDGANGGKPIWVVAGHINAARLEFPARQRRDLYVLADPNDRKTYFAGLRDTWRTGETALVANATGQTVMVVVPEPSYLFHQPEETEFRAHLCRRFDNIRRTGIIEPQPGRLAVEVYIATVRAELRKSVPRNCAFVPNFYIARPERGDLLKDGEQTYYGIVAFPAGVARLSLMLDGQPVGDAKIGIDQPGSFTAPDVLSFDPDYPRVQWEAKLNGSLLPGGAHRLFLRAELKDGRIVDSSARTVYVTH